MKTEIIQQVALELDTMLQVGMVTKSKFKRVSKYLETEAATIMVNDLDDNGASITEITDTIIALN
jgi:hypothetical protein